MLMALMALMKLLLQLGDLDNASAAGLQLVHDRTEESKTTNQPDFPTPKEPIPAPIPSSS